MKKVILLLVSVISINANSQSKEELVDIFLKALEATELKHNSINVLVVNKDGCTLGHSFSVTHSGQFSEYLLPVEKINIIDTVVSSDYSIEELDKYKVFHFKSKYSSITAKNPCI